jgi:colicin import membrane protein
METAVRKDDFPFPHADDRLGNAVSKAVSGAHAAVDQAADGASRAAGKAADLAAKAANTAQPAIDRAATAAHQAVVKAGDTAESAAVWAQNQADNLYAAEKSAENQARSYVAANPLKSIAVVLVAGLVIGRLTGLFSK